MKLIVLLMPYLGGFLIDLLANWDFQLDVTQNTRFTFCHIYLT